MSDALKPGRWLGNNELLMTIGRGGMATVWVARELAEGPPRAGELHARARDAGRLVAVKAMLSELAGDPEFVGMFIDEVRLVRSIRHPNVVTIFDVGEDDGTMWMSMEWVEGESLHAVIAEAGKRRAIPPEMAVRIIADVASGLHAAHELRDSDGNLRGVVHRDISPHNILIGTNGVVKLVDFGVAKAVGRVSEQTRVGQLKGKFGYMSPEQAVGASVDRRSDVFSLGVVLFELTTGRRLFRGESDVETLRLVTSGDVPHPSTIDPDYPPELEAIVLRALEREPELRYATARELEEDLRAFLKEQHTVVPQVGVASLLKRVVGGRIDARRRALEAVLTSLAREGAEHTSGGPAFLPSVPPLAFDSLPKDGSESGRISGTKFLTTALGGTATPNRTPSAGTPGRERTFKSLSALGYAIGVLGVAIALIVLLLLGR